MTGSRNWPHCARLLEVELASRALPRAHIALIDRLQSINMTVAEMVTKRDAVGYIRSNLEFHRTLYLRAQAPAMLAMAETVWLQLGPTMRSLYGRLRRTEPPHYHKLIIAALKAGDEPGLRLAVRSDVTQGCGCWLLKRRTAEASIWGQPLSVVLVCARGLR